MTSYIELVSAAKPRKSNNILLRLFLMILKFCVHKPVAHVTVINVEYVQDKSETEE